MDPNLEKIKDANLKDIQEGRVATSIVHARSYLTNILGDDRQDQITKELTEFTESLKQIAGSKFNYQPKPVHKYNSMHRSNSNKRK